MTTQEINSAAKAMTEQQVLNVIADWENRNELECLKIYKSLLKLGDSMQLACLTAIAKKERNVNFKMYYVAYCI